MKKPFDYEDIKALILRQGISPRGSIWPTAHFSKTLHYSKGDLHELAQLIRRQFGIRLTLTQINDMTTIQDVVELLNRLRLSGSGSLNGYAGDKW